MSAGSYRLWDATTVAIDGFDFGRTWMTWADIGLRAAPVKGSTPKKERGRIRVDGVARSATSNEPSSELAIVEKASYKGQPVMVLSNEASYDANDQGQRPQTVFVLQFDDHEMTTVVGGHGVPLDAFVRLLDTEFSVYEDSGLVLTEESRGRVLRRGGVGLVGSGEKDPGKLVVEVMDDSNRQYLPKGPGMKLGHGQLWRVQGEDLPTAIYANDSIVARIRATDKAHGDALVDMVNQMKMRALR